MSNLKRVNEFWEKLEFENDFGEESILLGRLTTDKAVIGVGSIALAFAAWAIAQAPLAIVVGLIAWNDLVSLGERREKIKKTPPVVDTQAASAYDEEEKEEYEYEEERRASSRSKQEPPQAAHPTGEETTEETGWTFYGDRQPIREDMPRQCKAKPRTTKGESGFGPQFPQVTNRAKRELIDRLKEECPGLLRLVKSHPIRMVGKQRTGKSTMAKLVCLLRMVLIQDHRVIAATPHYEPANPYPEVFKVVGVTPTGRDYDAIYREWRGLADRVQACRVNSNTTVWDEFGLFDQVMPEDEIKSVLTSCLRETMKFGEYPIFIVHGETAAFLPGSKGLVTVFLSGTVRVETIGELIEDEDGLETIRPTGKFHITWLDGSQEEGQIPGWLTEKYLLNLLGNPVVNHSNPEPEEECRLQEPLKTIYQFAKKQSKWVTVREIQRKDFPALKGKGAKNIRQYLGLLADTGLGEIEEEGKSDSAVSFLAK
jgi:hypothetical protein